MTRATMPHPGPGDPPQWWLDLEGESDLAGVQEMIRLAIRRGAIRVVPGEPGRVQIIPSAPRRAGD